MCWRGLKVIRCDFLWKESVLLPHRGDAGFGTLESDSALREIGEKGDSLRCLLPHMLCQLADS